MAKDAYRTGTHKLKDDGQNRAPQHSDGIYSGMTKRLAMTGEGFCDVQDLPKGNGSATRKKE